MPEVTTDECNAGPLGQGGSLTAGRSRQTECSESRPQKPVRRLDLESSKSVGARVSKPRVKRRRQIVSPA